MTPALYRAAAKWGNGWFIVDVLGPGAYKGEVRVRCVTVHPGMETCCDESTLCSISLLKNLLSQMESK